MTEHALIEACIAAPEDDAPRLVWADAVGGERGEFVVVQCKLASGRLTPSESGWLRRRQRELLRTFGAQWSELRGIASYARFRRGFVEAIAIDAAFVDDAAELFRRAPLLRSITATGMNTNPEQAPVAKTRMQTLLGSETLRRVHGLYIERPTHTEEYDTGNYWIETDTRTMSFAAETFAAEKQAFSHLRAFGSRDAIDAGSLRALGVLRRVERWWSHEQNLPQDVIALLAELPLVELDLAYGPQLEAILPRLPRTLRSLRVRSSRKDPCDRFLDLLARSPCAQTLERLAIFDGIIDGDAAPLGRMQRLHSLDLRDVSIRREQARVVDGFLANPLPALRELRPFDNLTPETLRPIVERLGPQLELLDLRGCGELRTVGDSIDAIVPGDVRYGILSAYDPLLLPDGDAPEPWWEPTTVRL